MIRPFVIPIIWFIRFFNLHLLQLHLFVFLFHLRFAFVSCLKQGVGSLLVFAQL